MALLTADQETHLKMVRAANMAWREAKTFARARAKVLAEKEVASFLVTMDTAVRNAFDAGVPKRQIQMKGLGTSDPSATTESLARSVALVAVLKAVDAIYLDENGA